MNRRNFLKAAGANVGALAISGPDAPGATGRAQGPALRPAVANRLTADVAVIGAGVFGGWTALSIREMGLSVGADRSVRSGKFEVELRRRSARHARALRRSAG